MDEDVSACSQIHANLVTESIKADKNERWPLLETLTLLGCVLLLSDFLYFQVSLY